jgi:hypothetical protein
MTIRETDTSADAGTDNAPLISDDDDYSALAPDFDPSEDTEAEADPAETASEETTDDETPAETDGQAEEAEKAAEEPAAAAADTAKVKLPDGSETTVAELRNGYLRQSDYTRKAQEVANLRNSLTAQADRMNRTVQAFAALVDQSVPPMPSIELAQSDPARYVREKAIHEAAALQIEQLLAMTGEPTKVKAEIDEAEQQRAVARENEALARAFPETTKEDTRRAFFQAATEAATEIGFTPDDIRGVLDHRVFALAYWAKKGMEADKARKTAATKVANVPPVTAAPKRPAVAGNAQNNAKAMRRLSQTGSIKDAVLIDFD